MTMVERVARAICLEGHKLAYPDGPWRDGELERKVDQYWSRHIPAARAAIEAMREPTGVMITAIHSSHRPGWDVSWRTVWTTMIDAALAD